MQSESYLCYYAGLPKGVMSMALQKSFILDARNNITRKTTFCSLDKMGSIDLRVETQTPSDLSVSAIKKNQESVKQTFTLGTLIYNCAKKQDVCRIGTKEL